MGYEVKFLKPVAEFVYINGIRELMYGSGKMEVHGSSEELWSNEPTKTGGCGR